MLSRLPLPMDSKNPEEDRIYSIQIAYLPITDEEIRLETGNDDILKNVVKYMTNDCWPVKPGEDYKPYYNKRDELFLEDGIILWGLRVVVRRSLRCKI